MAEESKSGGSSSDADPEVDAVQEGEASRGGGDASRTSRSGPPSVSFPLLTSRELLEQHVDAQLQQLETGEIRELSLQTIWTMDVLFKSSPRGRKSAKTAVDAAADGPPAFTAAPSAPPATVIAVASSDARQELPPPPQLQAPDRRTGPDPRNFPSMMDSHATRKKRSPPFARFPRSSRSSEWRGNTGRWTEEEHKNFLRGYSMYGRDWVVIRELFVTTRTDTQIRTHAQKFLKSVEAKAYLPREFHFSSEGNNTHPHRACPAGSETAGIGVGARSGGCTSGTNSEEAAAPSSSIP